METKTKIPEVQLRSPEVQQLLGRMPGGFVRYGATLILLILLIVLAVCAFVPYEENVQMRVRILPNVPCHEVRTSTDGTIVQCRVADNAQVAAGDTLLVYTDGNRQCCVVSPQSGSIHLLQFCIAGESIKRGDALFEVRSNVQTKQKAYAIVDTLPSNVNLSQSSVYVANVDSAKLKFQVKQTQSDSATGITRVLLQSEQKVAIVKEIPAIIRIPSKKGSLLNQLIGKKFP